jgi:hypothetical protein
MNDHWEVEKFIVSVTHILTTYLVCNVEFKNFQLNPELYVS